MCVTPTFARIGGTKTYCYAVGGRHVVAYQNVATTPGGNVMILNLPGADLQMVRNGPERTRRLMSDVVADLPDAVELREKVTLGGLRMPVRVESYGDSYTVVLAEGPGDIFEAVMSDEVPSDRRPRPDDVSNLRALITFYTAWYPQDAFVLACFSGSVKPQYPVTVSYVPHDPTVLTVPGLDGHDGELPIPNSPVHRDFDVAFGVQGLDLPHAVGYTDQVSSQWAPDTVAGFRDNRWGPNGDYVIPLESLKRGLTGPALVQELRTR